MTFLLGFVLAGARAPWVAIERSRWIALGLAILAWACIAAYNGFYGADLAPTPPHLLVLLQRVVYSAEQWLAIVAVLGFARRHLVRDNAARRYLTTAIFPVYILHQTVIVVIAHSLKSAQLSPAVEGPLLVIVTAAACFLGYEVIRRVRVLRTLFGLSAAPATSGTAARVPSAPWAGSVPLPTAHLARSVPQDVQ
jgi:hypothetical protein